jgi:hypothetical protein
MLLRMLCIVAVAAIAARAEDNPAYTSWAKVKAGTVVTYKTDSTTSIMGMENKTSSTLTYTLKELTDEKAVVELQTVTVIMGNEIKGPPIPLTHLKTAPKGTTTAPGAENVKTTKPEEGTETVKLGGTEYKSKWTKVKISVAGSDSESTTWSSDDVPGLLLKSETTAKGVVSSKTVTELVSVKKP